MLLDLVVLNDTRLEVLEEFMICSPEPRAIIININLEATTLGNLETFMNDQIDFLQLERYKQNILSQFIHRNCTSIRRLFNLYNQTSEEQMQTMDTLFNSVVSFLYRTGA